MICGTGSVYVEYRSKPGSMCQIIQIGRLPPDNMSYATKIFLKEQDRQVGIDDLLSVNHVNIIFVLAKTEILKLR